MSASRRHMPEFSVSGSNIDIKFATENKRSDKVMTNMNFTEVFEAERVFEEQQEAHKDPETESTVAIVLAFLSKETLGMLEFQTMI